MTIGRDKNSDITLNDPQASRNQAVLRRLGVDDDNLIDSGSANGSFINERKQTQAAAVTRCSSFSFWAARCCRKQ